MASRDLADKAGVDERVAALEAENALLRATISQSRDRPGDAQIRAVADSLPVLISYVDAEQHYRFNNKAYERWFGHDRREMRGKHMREVLGEEAYRALKPIVEKVLSGEQVSIDQRVPYKDGGERTVHIEYVPDRRDNGAIAGFFALIQDISEREHVERTLRESEARFRAMADSAPAPIWVTNDEGLEFVNEAMAQFSGLPRERMRGNVWMELVHPDDLPDVLNRREKAWATCKPYDFNARLRRADGEWRWFHASCNPRLDGEGAFLGYVGLAIDTTESRRAEAELHEREAHLAALLGQTAAGIAEKDLSGRFITVNDRFCVLVGRSRDELLGLHMDEVTHPEDLPANKLRFRQLTETGCPFEIQKRYVRPDGSAIWVNNTVSLIQMDDEVATVLSVSVDITDRKAAEDALRELNQSLERRVEDALAEREQAQEALRQSQKMEAIGQLTGGIAHDFNNLLTVISGNLDMAVRRLGPEIDPRIARSLGSASIGAQRAATLTQRLLAFSRRQPLAPKAVEPNALLAGMSELLHRTLGENIDVETRLAAGPGRIEVDPHQLESALLNLAVNARDAMPDGGRLLIETAAVRVEEDDWLYGDVEPGAYIRISVSDSGTGMNADTRRRAVEPFFTTKEIGKGTGLGLSMVYGFVRQSGGHLQIDSEEGQGTAVHIYLPRLSGEASETEPIEAAFAPRGATGETILVCEDDEDVRAYTVELLRELGYQVLEATDGESTMQIIHDAGTRIDLLFTDVVLPGGMSGADLAMQAGEVRPGLKVLFTTGYARDAIVHDGRLDPGIELVNKPFQFADLALRLRDVLDR